MSQQDPYEGMSIAELEKLRDLMRATISRAQGELHTLERRLLRMTKPSIASPLSARGKPPLPERPKP